MALHKLTRRLRRAGEGFVEGAVEGAQRVGYLPTKRTVTGAARGDKSDIASLGLIAASALPG